ncbi:MAG: Ribulose-phosphate 3-epimerase [Parcubacteria group bacterium GW2011_GWA2_47_8]|nr:MAG: Ribulose-phosphate 3-epimerase [Parcubacteria group bacterium GW2011_GWA2_47_8]OHB18268.1 MAG: hypothetical protein A2666_00680 [Parcubacteria group bacterium RIFCSPHIGHO2_01_FULL_47_10b]
MQVIPAVLETELAEIQRKINLIGPATHWVHLDVGDGSFTKQTFEDGPRLQAITSGHANSAAHTKFEAHLMVTEPWTLWETWLSAGCSRFYIHYRSFIKIPHKTRSFAVNNLINTMHTHEGFEVGMALEMHDSITVLNPFLSKLDCVLLMAIDTIGAQGHRFNEQVLDKAKSLKTVWPNGCVSVDGGVQDLNIMRLKEVGGDCAIVGSNIFTATDPIAQLKKLQSMVE